MLSLPQGDNASEAKAGGLSDEMPLVVSLPGASKSEDFEHLLGILYPD